MISTFVALAQPSKAVISLTIGGLLVLLAASQLMDYEGSPVRSGIRFLRAFTTPLLVFFVLVEIVSIIQIMA
jgi:hypothetical protein